MKPAEGLLQDGVFSGHDFIFDMIKRDRRRAIFSDLKGT
jgi:hypothetical protein